MVVGKVFCDFQVVQQIENAGDRASVILIITDGLFFDNNRQLNEFSTRAHEELGARIFVIGIGRTNSDQVSVCMYRYAWPCVLLAPACTQYMCSWRVYGVYYNVYTCVWCIHTLYYDIIMCVCVFMYVHYVWYSSKCTCIRECVLALSMKGWGYKGHFLTPTFCRAC